MYSALPECYQNRPNFRRLVKTTILAAVHVLILVISTDLGSALIYFMTYLIMLYVATRDWKWLALGFGAFVVAAVAAYFLFAHVRVRVEIWKDPFSVYEGSGYQVAQALFAIAAGGWFGTGLYQGSPTEIPYVDQDFMFAAIARRDGKYFLHLHDSDLYELLYHVCQYRNENDEEFLPLCGTWTCLHVCDPGIFNDRQFHEDDPDDRCHASVCQLRRKFHAQYTDHVLCDPGTLYTKKRRG